MMTVILSLDIYTFTKSQVNLNNYMITSFSQVTKTRNRLPM